MNYTPYFKYWKSIKLEQIMKVHKMDFPDFNFLDQRTKSNIQSSLNKKGDDAKSDYEKVFKLSAEGKSSKEIANILNIKEFSVVLILQIGKDILKEDLTLKDLKGHMGTSDFTKDWINLRRKIVGPGNKSSKIKGVKVNRKQDYITFVFKSVPTYDTKSVQSVNPDTLQMDGNVRQYTQEIRILDFFKLASTKPGYVEKNLSIAEIKEILKVANVQVWCNDPSFHFQGMDYYLTQLDGAIHPNNIVPKVWNKFQDTGNSLGLVCKHLSSILSQIEFFVPIMSGMINKVLKLSK